jgi:hypothetical protein
MELSGQLHAPAALLLGKRPTGTHCTRRRNGYQWWYVGRCGEEKNRLPLPRFKPRFSVVQPLASTYFRKCYVITKVLNL